MSFQAYLDTIREKTGLGPDDFRRIAAEKGLSKHADIIAWAKGDLGLGHGHANAIAAVLKQGGAPVPTAEKFAKHFAGKKAVWQAPADGLLNQIKLFGPDVEVAAADSYINLNKAGKKFGILAVTADRLDVGIKLKGIDPTGRLETAGSWNTMVTHRVRVVDAAQIDGELVDWLKAAYAKA